MTRNFATTASVALTLLLPACTDAGGGSPGFATRDSAGVVIAESTAPVWEAGTGWTVAPEPSLRIGMLDGPAEYQLDRVYSAVRLDDGGVALTNGGSEIRIFAADGAHVRTIGGSGEGPGEFRNVSQIFISGDTLFGYDSQLLRLTSFAMDGTLHGTSQLEPWENRRPFLRGRAGDGALVASYSSTFRPGQVESGYSRDETWVLRNRLDTGTIDTLTSVPGSEMFVDVRENGGFTVTAIPLGKLPVVAVGESAVVIGSNEAYELIVHGESGPERIVRRAESPKPIDQAMWSQAVEERLSIYDDEWLSQMQPILAKIDPLATLPFYQAAHLDRAGHLWVRNFAAPGEDDTSWSVFDQEGRFLGDVSMPVDLLVKEIGEDYVLGIWRDDLDVEYVHVYELAKE